MCALALSLPRPLCVSLEGIFLPHSDPQGVQTCLPHGRGNETGGGREDKEEGRREENQGKGGEEEGNEFSTCEA